MRQVFGFVFVLGATLAATAVGAVGCSSSDDTGTTTADTGVKKDTGVATDSGSPTDTGAAKDTGTTPTGDEACGAATSNSECQKCCSTNHTAAYNEFVKTLLGCGCKAGNCDKDCAATACAATPASPDAKCNSCLNTIQGTACKADLTTCAGAACKDFFGCIADQACNDKP